MAKGQWKHKISDVRASDFDDLALETFHFQYANNAVYKAYTDSLHVVPAQLRSISQIPFLPIRFFKSHTITTTAFEPQVVFESSGTTGTTPSRHFVKDTAIYQESFTKGFELFYGDPADWCILGLLPSYLERNNSSLVFMVNELIRQSNHPDGGFYLDEFEKLAALLIELEKQQQKTLLIGVTFALLDFAAYMATLNLAPLQHTIIMETGGMKGRREELVRPQVHTLLKDTFGVPAIHSEYGMTELLSQSYSKGDGFFQPVPWMKVLVREEDDPLSVRQFSVGSPQSGVINIIDLANIYSCSFIATDDTGRCFPDGNFEITGRMDNSDLRGCSLMTI